MSAAKAPKAQRGRHAKGAMLSYGSRTDVGLVRDHNEDSLTVTPPLFAVADGMGGHAAGEVASEVAIQSLVAHAPHTADGDDLARAVVEANRAVIRAAREGLGRQGMGTTMTAAVLDGPRMVIAQVGDSRAYLLHQDRLQAITRDHSLMADLIESGQITPEQAKTHPQRSVITRALGSDPNTLPDIYEMTVEDGDRLLLCSDGLSGMVDDDLLESTLIRVGNPQKCADTLVDEALAAGGHDNVTAIVVDVAAGAEKRVAKERRRGRIGAVLAIIALIAVLAGAVVGGNVYLNHVAFLTVQNDQVVICRGIPGEFMGFQTWKIERNTGLSVDDLALPPNTASRLTEEGIRTDSVEDAEELLSTWQAQAEQTQGSSSGAAASDTSDQSSTASGDVDASGTSSNANEASGASTSATDDSSTEGGDAS